MNRDDLLERIRVCGRDIVDEFLPEDANVDLDNLIGDHRHEVDADAYRLFVSLRALLRDSGMSSCESDCEAGQVLALFYSRAA